MEYTLFKDTYVMYELLEFIDESSIIALCKTSKKLNKICKNYIKLEDNKRFKLYICNCWWNDTQLFRNYCENNYVIKIRKLMKIGIGIDWDYGLWGACEGGHMDIVKFMIEKGANHWGWGLHNACKNGNTDIVKLLIEKDVIWCSWCKKTIEEHLE